MVPYSTLRNAHPPGLSVYLAAAWSVFGFSPPVTRLSVCLLAALALLGVFRLAREAFGDWQPAAAVAALTGFYPVWFAQSTLAQADMPACAATVWALVFFLRGRVLAAALLFTAAALSKEISIGTPAALALYELARGRRRSGVLLLLPVLPLLAWFTFYRRRTGFWFGDAEFVRYNATATLSFARFFLALGHRALHLSAHLNLFVPVLLALGSLAFPRVRPGLPPETLRRVWVILAANAVLFSVLGGALLTRYLLPEYALVLLLAVAAVWGRRRRWQWFPGVSAAAFALALLLPPPYRIAPEDTLAYADAVHLEQDAIAEVARRYPDGPVLTAWPVTDGLRKPELGYVRQALPVAAVDDFSLESLRMLTGQPQGYATAIVFSTKYEPPGASLPPWDGQAEERYFDLHHDLTAEAVAALLGGRVVWRERRGGEWAAVLRFDPRFNHGQRALLGKPFPFWEQGQSDCVLPEPGTRFRSYNRR